MRISELNYYFVNNNNFYYFSAALLGGGQPEIVANNRNEVWFIKKIRFLCLLLRPGHIFCIRYVVFFFFDPVRNCFLRDRSFILFYSDF